MKARVPFLLAAALACLAGRAAAGAAADAPPPAQCAADINAGLLDGRRVRVEGVLWRALPDPADPARARVRLGTPYGVLHAHVPGPAAPLAALRDRCVSLEGVCASVFNARGEFLRAVIEADAPDALRPLGEAPARPADESCRAPCAGPFARDAAGHARRVRGEVTYVDSRLHCFVFQGAFAMPVHVDADDPLPEVGDLIEVEGFPQMEEGCGVLKSARFAVLEKGVRRVRPDALNTDLLERVVAAEDPARSEYDFRLVTVTGRYLSHDYRAEGWDRVAILHGGRRVNAYLACPLPKEIEDRLEDFPNLSITGIIHMRLEQPNGKDAPTVPVKIFPRSPGDITVLPDPEAGRRRLERRLRALALLVTALVAVYFIVAWARALRRRVRDEAVAEDRKRMAGDLHDTISQHLSGARLLLYSVQSQADALPAGARNALSMAGDVLEAARREVRDTVMNLQSDETMKLDLAALLEKAANRVSGTFGVTVACDAAALPARLPLPVKTDVLAIANEAMTNAVKHGGAKNLRIAAEPLPRGGFALSVLNDGTPFDATRTLGTEDGHFGLSGMRERARRSGFAISFGRRGEENEVRLERSV